MCTAKSSSWCWSMRFAMTPSNCQWERLSYETPPHLLLKNVTCSRRGRRCGKSQEQMLIPNIQNIHKLHGFIYIKGPHITQLLSKRRTISRNKKTLAQGTTPCPNLAPTSLDGSRVFFLGLYTSMSCTMWKNHAYEEVWSRNTWLQHTMKTKNPLKPPIQTNMNHNTSRWNVLNV